MPPIGVDFSQPGLPGGVRAGDLTAGAPSKAGQGTGTAFAETLKAALGQVNTVLQESDAAAAQLATGEATNLHEVVLATERANLALQFTMAIRNKLLEAYNELMRMPV